MIMIALVDGKPKVLNLYEILSEYLKFQKEVVTRRTQFDLKKGRGESAHLRRSAVLPSIISMKSSKLSEALITMRKKN